MVPIIWLTMIRSSCGLANLFRPNTQFFEGRCDFSGPGNGGWEIYIVLNLFGNGNWKNKMYDELSWCWVILIRIGLAHLIIWRIRLWRLSFLSRRQDLKSLNFWLRRFLGLSRRWEWGLGNNRPWKAL
jgi:hypothetical protein